MIVYFFRRLYLMIFTITKLTLHYSASIIIPYTEYSYPFTYFFIFIYQILTAWFCLSVKQKKTLMKTNPSRSNSLKYAIVYYSFICFYFSRYWSQIKSRNLQRQCRAGIKCDMMRKIGNRFRLSTFSIWSQTDSIARSR